MMSNRGVKVWPDGMPETFCTDSFRCRFQTKDMKEVPMKAALDLLDRVHAEGIELVKTESLRTFDGQAGFSLAQGQ
jgi:isocitrate dehydrogenase